MHCHPHILIRIVEQLCAVCASSKSSRFSTDKVHVVKLPDVGSVLGYIHALDQPTNFVFAILLTILCEKSDVNESLGCALEMRSADVGVSQLQWFPFARPTHRNHNGDNPPLQLQEVALQRTTQKQIRLFEFLPCFFVLDSLAHSLDRIFLRAKSHTLVCVHPDQIQQFLACILTCIGAISQTPSECTHSISSRPAANARSSGRYPPLTSSQNFPPPFKI